MEASVSHRAQVFPFSAIVGQETLKTALLVNAVDPRVGGVLIRGDKGTAKSTAVRALAEILPPISVVEGCRFSCDPEDEGHLCSECLARAESGPLPVATRRPRVVELPVSATEDRLVGTLDMEHALRHGERRFEAGLMATANRGILYVDEVNLLEDHLVDTLLDAAAMGVNTVEREGVAFSHPAKFILVGTMNPEEGDVRPQLLDRFGLCADVRGLMVPEQRVNVVERRAAFEDDPAAFAAEWAEDEATMEETLARARELVRSIRVPRDMLFLIANVCAEMGVDGHRADLTMARAASALAAFEGRDAPSVDDVRAVAPLVLAHRMRRRPFDDVSIDQMRIDELIPAAASGGGDAPPETGQGDPSVSDNAGRAAAVLRAIGTEAVEATPSERLVASLDTTRRTGAGRRHETRSDDGRGRYSGSEAPRSGKQPDVAVDATIRQAAVKGAATGGGLAVNVTPEDIRAKVRKHRVGASIILCVDASGSMGAAKRMEAAKGAALELLTDAYKRRDRVGLVAFRGNEAEVLLAPTSSVELARLKLKDMETGGATPLASGLAKALELLESERRRNTDVVPWIVLVSDGRGNVGLKGGLGSDDTRAMAARVREAKVNALIVDTSQTASAAAPAREIAKLAEGEYIRLPRPDSTAMSDAVRARLEAV